MADFNDKLMNGPIPGENYTRDTKNFAWHRPPQFTQLDEAIEYSVKYIMDEERADNYILMLEVGWSVVDMSQMYIMNGIGRGLWSFDLGLLMAGPIAHILVIMARGAEIKYDLGTENDTKTASIEYFRAMSRENPEIVEAMNEVLDPQDMGDDSEEPDEQAGGEPTPPEDVATQPPSSGLGGMPQGQPSAGDPADPSQGVM